MRFPRDQFDDNWDKRGSERDVVHIKAGGAGPIFNQTLQFGPIYIAISIPLAKSFGRFGLSCHGETSIDDKPLQK